jgi:hypothetical protein
MVATLISLVLALTSTEIVERVRENRAPKDLVLQARLFPQGPRGTPQSGVVRMELLIRNTPDAVKTVLRVPEKGTTIYIMAPLRGGAAQFWASEDGKPARKLDADEVFAPFLGSHFSLFDLSMPFLRWPPQKNFSEEPRRGRSHYVLDSRPPADEVGPYARILWWADKDAFAPTRAEFYDADGVFRKRFLVTSFKRLGEIWVIKGMEISAAVGGQALPSQEKSRLEVLDGDYDAQLPDEIFTPEGLAR